MSIDPNAPSLVTPQSNTIFEVYDEKTVKKISYQALAQSLSDFVFGNTGDFLNVKSFGAFGDGVTNDTVPFQNAINAAGSAGRILYIPVGTYKIGSINLPNSTSNNFTILGNGPNSSKITNVDGDLFTSTKTTNCNFVNFGVSSSGGNIFTGYFVNCLFSNLSLTQNNINKSILYHYGGNNNSDNLLENAFYNCQLFGKTTHVVPLIYIRSSNGAVSLNDFSKLRCTNSGNYFFYLESTALQSYVYSNSFENINFEVTSGGNISLKSCYNTSIKNCNTYDITGTFSNDLYSLDKNTDSGLKTIYTTIENTQRFGGTPALNKHDINLINAVNTVFINNGGTSSNYSINVSSASVSGAIKINDKTFGGISMFSSNGSEYRIYIADDGTLSTGLLS